MEKNRVKILPPWITFIHKIQALFDGDPQIACNVDYSGAHPAIILACNNGDKVAALQQILPTEIEYGGVILEIAIDGIPSNRFFVTKKELFEVAFDKNPAFAYAVCPVEDGYNWFAVTNLNDCHGVLSTLYEDIAREILTGDAVQGVYFNTDVERGQLGMPLGQWP